MNCMIEDFPTPGSPTRRIVYGAFVLFFDVLMVPFLRDSTSLGNTVRIRLVKDDDVTHLRIRVLSFSNAFLQWVGEMLLDGTLSMGGSSWSVVVGSSELRGKTHGFGAT